MKTISARIDEDIHDFIKENVDERGITLNEWLNNAIMCYAYWLENAIEDYRDDLTWEDLEDMGWDELVDVVEDEELDIDTSEYRTFLSKDTDGLRQAIGEALGFEFEETDDSDDSDDSGDDSDDSGDDSDEK